MMDSPFYRSLRGTSPRYPQTTSSASHKPKVVSIPVHFIHPTEENIPKPNPISRPDSAIRIQKLWRGFRVRQNVKKLLDIERELLEVETAILDSKTVEAIRRDERERLRLSERLMSLLFRLDSVRGFDAGVRDLRKALIRRAIVLQEKVDSIAVSPESECDHQQLQIQEEPQCQIQEEKVDDNITVAAVDNPIEEPVEREVVVVKEEKKRNTMEDVMEENNRLMRLMADLFERNEMQTQILSSLSERVGQLENAFACDKLRRRVKKQKKSRNSKSFGNHY